MNIVEKEAKKFIDIFFGGARYITLESLTSDLDSKIYNLKRDRDKLDFLKSLRNLTSIELKEHKLDCKRNSCDFCDKRENGIFVIDQKIDEINKYYTYKPLDDDNFTPEEESILHTKVNEIIDKLQKLGYGQEILYEEIESLKNHFDLGKKTWKQLLLGKIFDITASKVIENTIAIDIINYLADGYSEIKKII